MSRDALIEDGNQKENGGELKERIQLAATGRLIDESPKNLRVRQLKSDTRGKQEAQ